MIERKLVKWLKKFADGTTQQRVAELLEIPQPTVSRWLKSTSKDVKISRLEEISENYKPGSPVWNFVREIEEELDPKPTPKSPDERLLKLWKELFRDDPGRGEKVLLNMSYQEAMKLTDLVSAVIHHILANAESPKESIGAVVQLLSRAETRKKSTTLVRIVKEYLEEYDRIH